MLALLLLLTARGAGAAESKYNEPFPTAASIKGLQVEMLEDALELGVKHAALNLNITALAQVHGETNGVTWTSRGRKFFFHESYLQGMDRQVKGLSGKGVVVYMIVLSYASGDPKVNEVVLHPGYDPSCPNHLGAFNTATPEGRAWFEACMGMLAERWSRPDQKLGRVSGYIMGNEVNSHWWWSNMGKVSMESFADSYETSVRMAHDAIRAQASWPRIYLSLEHHWNIRFGAGNTNQAFPGKPFLEYFAARAKSGGDYNWNVAFHPYPENLFEPRFWKDKSATTNENTPRITFKNLEMLPRFLERPEMLYDGHRRRIILSEQGFHTPKGPEGEAIQAAAFCYAYKKCEGIPQIDAFILHRHVDHPHEGGLLLGLRGLRQNGQEPPKKKSYGVFKAADTPGWKEAFEFALPMIGYQNWDEALR